MNTQIQITVMCDVLYRDGNIHYIATPGQAFLYYNIKEKFKYCSEMWLYILLHNSSKKFICPENQLLSSMDAFANGVPDQVLEYPGGIRIFDAIKKLPGIGSEFSIAGYEKGSQYRSLAVKDAEHLLGKSRPAISVGQKLLPYIYVKDTRRLRKLLPNAPRYEMWTNSRGKMSMVQTPLPVTVTSIEKVIKKANRYDLYSNYMLALEYWMQNADVTELYLGRPPELPIPEKLITRAEYELMPPGLGVTYRIMKTSDYDENDPYAFFETDRPVLKKFVETLGDSGLVESSTFY